MDEGEKQMKQSQNSKLADESYSRLLSVFSEDDIKASRAYEEGLPNIVFDVWHILTGVCNKMPDVSGAMLTLEDIININKYTNPFEVEVSIGLIFTTYRIFSF